MPRNGPRWYRVRCAACTAQFGIGIEHGFSAGALAVIVEAAQGGDITTVKGNSVCVIAPLLDHVPHSTDPKVDWTERVD